MLNKRRIASTVFISIAAELVNKIFPLVTIYFVLRRLGTSEFGAAQFSITLMEICAPFIIFGYNIYGTILVGKHRDQPLKIGEAITDIMILRLGHALIALSGIVLFLCLSPDHRTYLFPTLCLSFYLFFSATELSWVQIGLQKMSIFSLFQALSKIPALIGILVFVKDPSDALTYACFLLSANALCCFMTTIHILRRYKPAPLHWPRLMPLFKKGTTFAIGLMIMGTLDKLDILTSEFIGGSIGIGLYAGQARLVHSFNQMFAVISSTFLGEIVGARSETSEKAHYDLGMWLLFAIFSAVLLGSTLVGENLVVLILGEDFRSSSIIFSILLLGLVANIIFYVYGMQILYVKERTRYVTYAMLITVLSLLTFCIMGGYFYGIIGIAVGAAIGRLVGASCLTYFGWVYYPLNFKILARALWPAVFMWVILYTLKIENIFVTLGLGAALVILGHLALNWFLIKPYLHKRLPF